MKWGRENLPSQIKKRGQDVLDTARQIERDPAQRRKWTETIVGALAANLVLCLVGINYVQEAAPRPEPQHAACLPDKCPPNADNTDLRAGGKRTPSKKANPQATIKTASTTTTAPIPASTNPSLSAPTPNVRVKAVEIHAAQRKPLTYAQYAEKPQYYIDRIPDLAKLAIMFPSKAQFFQSQKVCVDKLIEQVDVTPDDAKQLTVDTSRQDVFSQHPFYNRRISPKMFVIHTTGLDPNKTVDEVAEGMMKATRKNANGQDVPDRRSVGFMTTPNGAAYQTMEGLNRMPAQALGGNEFSNGVENFARDVCEMTPEQLETSIILSARVNRLNRNPVNVTTVLSHLDISFLFNNPNYDPDTGTATSMEKFDVPRDLTRFIASEAEALDKQLYPPNS